MIMEHFEITFIELHAILIEARYSLKEEIKNYGDIFDEDVINEDKRRISLIDDLTHFITACPGNFFKIVEDNPF